MLHRKRYSPHNKRDEHITNVHECLDTTESTDKILSTVSRIAVLDCRGQVEARRSARRVTPEA